MPANFLLVKKAQQENYVVVSSYEEVLCDRIFRFLYNGKAVSDSLKDFFTSEE